MELTLNRLTHQTEPEAYEDSIYQAITRLQPDPVLGLMNVVIHFADAMAAVMERECGSREAAIESLQRQITEADALTVADSGTETS
jgi:hypothetical protein